VAIGLDTSVVLRLLVGEPRPLTEAARRRIERALAAGERVIVTDLVVAEVFHALRHHYDVPEAVALAQLRGLLDSGIVHPDPAGTPEAVAPGARRQAGIVDRLIVARHASLGVTTTTFDRRQARLEGVVLLRP
jgi:predicted nucleic acid-binding protein